MSGTAQVRTDAFVRPASAAMPVFVGRTLLSANCRLRRCSRQITNNDLRDVVTNGRLRNTLLSGADNPHVPMLDSSRVQTDAIRAGSPRCRIRIPGGLLFRRLWTVRPKRHGGTGRLAGRADLLPVGSAHPAGLRSSCAVTRRTSPGRPSLAPRARVLSGNSFPESSLAFRSRIRQPFSAPYTP